MVAGSAEVAAVNTQQTEAAIQAEQRDKVRANKAISQWWLDRIDVVPFLPEALKAYRLKLAEALRGER